MATPETRRELPINTAPLHQWRANQPAAGENMAED
jgi:hypothetical protein